MYKKRLDESSLFRERAVLFRDVLAEPLLGNLRDRAVGLHLVEDLLDIVAQRRVVLGEGDAELADRADCDIDGCLLM